MTLHWWPRLSYRRLLGPAAPARRPGTRRRMSERFGALPSLEALEDRTLLTT
jgi:hypothetical protein